MKQQKHSLPGLLLKEVETFLRHRPVVRVSTSGPRTTRRTETDEPSARAFGPGPCVLVPGRTGTGWCERSAGWPGESDHCLKHGTARTARGCLFEATHGFTSDVVGIQKVSSP